MNAPNHRNHDFGIARLTALKELWFHTGTACNLECPFCLEGSKPGDSRLERLTLADIAPLMDQALSLGVQRFCFTGGEPLIVKDIVKILAYALQHRPCLVLTNGTAPLIKRAHQLKTLQQQPHALSFQISIDAPDEAAHDSQRGWGNFMRAIEAIKLLNAVGFNVSIARHSTPTEDTQAVSAQYRTLFKKHSIADDIALVPLPNFERPGFKSDVVGVTAGEWSSFLSMNRPATMCTYSRMALKRGGQLRMHACPFTDDDSAFETTSDLSASTNETIRLSHHRCKFCVSQGTRYSDGA